MPFPFMPFGAIFAGIILGTALTAFVWALMAIDRAASRAADSVVSGLVAGFRGWSSELRPTGGDPGLREASSGEPPLEPTQVVSVSRVR